ncbi:MAG: DUF5134 domain-containing protein [Pseudonocardia sp.]
MGLGVAWLDLLLGGTCLLIGVVYVALLVTRRAPALGAAAHAVMGFGMAAMFLPTLDVLPRPAWVVAFVLVVAWFGAEALRAGSFTGGAGHHVVGASAMLFMLLAGHQHGTPVAAGTAGGGHAHHGAAAAAGGTGLLVTAAALALAAWFVADVVRELTRGGAPVTVGGGALAAAPVTAGRGVAGTAQLVMGVAMAVMLLGMA